MCRIPQKGITCPLQAQGKTQDLQRPPTDTEFSLHHTLQTNTGISCRLISPAGYTCSCSITHIVLISNNILSGKKTPFCPRQNPASSSTTTRACSHDNMPLSTRRTRACRPDDTGQRARERHRAHLQHIKNQYMTQMPESRLRTYSKGRAELHCC